MTLQKYLTISIFITQAFLLISFSIQASSSITNKSDIFRESLLIKPLIDGKLLARFEFTSLYRDNLKSLRWANDIQIFPLSMVDLVAATDLNKLHFSLTKGVWDHQNWGLPTQPFPTGAHIRAQFSHHNENLSRSWDKLVNLLAGKFCASLNSIDKKNLVTSKIALVKDQLVYNSSQHVLYSSLPEETFCTENLTPWKKLLPCYYKSGLSALLNPVYLFKSSFSSLSIDIAPKPCIKDGVVFFDCEQVQLKQTITVVFNPLQLFDGKLTWSLIKLFGNQVQDLCPVTSSSLIHVDITDLDDKEKLFPQNFIETSVINRLIGGASERRLYATYDIIKMLNNFTHVKDKKVNIGFKQNKLFKRVPASKMPITPVDFKVHIAGTGVNDGTIVATIINNYDTPIKTTYLSVLPHFMRVYLSSLQVKTKSGQDLKPDMFNFALSREKSPMLIEFSLEIPALTQVQVSYYFERKFLRWTDYKPDANKGILVGPFLVSVTIPPTLSHSAFPKLSLDNSNSSQIFIDSNGEDATFNIYSKPLLIILPTPDFSMPYNVICLVTAGIGALFGALHSITTKRPYIFRKKKEESKADEPKEKME